MRVNCFCPTLFMYLIYAHEQTTVALQLLVDEGVDNSLFMCVDRIQHTKLTQAVKAALYLDRSIL